MSKTFDEQIFEFKDGLAEYIRNHPLPITALVMIFNETTQVLVMQQQASFQKYKQESMEKEVKK